MVKLVIILVNFLVILAFQIFPGDVSVKLDIPDEVQAGSQFEIKLTLNKGDLDGFSRFQQNIPAGLTAVAGTSSNADFTFSDKKVRLIWLRIPETEEITVTYLVKVDERLKGTFDLGGKFSYIENNERKSVDIQPVSINIVPSPTVDPSLIVDINDFERLTMPYTDGQAEAVSVACIRQTPVPGSQGDYVVNVLVNKNFTRQFAKIEENVPAGYTAVALDPRDAIFTFKEQKVKFLWMNLPSEPYYTVSYRLIPKNQAKLPSPVINGSFSYLVDEKSVSVDILERDINLAEVTPENAGEMIAMAIATEPVKKETTPLTVETADVSVSNETRQPKDNLTAQKTGTKSVKQNVRKTGKATGTSNNVALLTPEEGVYYRIQLAAGHKPVNINRYFSKMKLEKKVQLENHDGWRKYSIGSFAVYKEARDYRVHIWNTTPVKDAFITAYNSGQRITVQEALMLTEQRWYQ